MSTKIRKSDFVKELLAKTFPAYKGRKFRVEIADTFYFDPYWSGGSRTSYALVDMTTEKAAGGEGFGTQRAPWNNETVGRHELPPNCILVEHSIYGGEDMGITFTVGSSNLLGFDKLIAIGGGK